MKIKYLAHASFLIVSDNGTKIITDPYKAGGYSGAIGYAPINEEADIVLVSHDHDDHNQVSEVLGSPEVVKGAGSHSVSGVTIKGVNSFHDSSNGKERGSNTIFVFDVDGLKVCHLGDLGHLLTDNQIKEIGQIDILLIPVGGFFTIDHQQATKVVDQLKPKVVIPMHFKTEKLDFPVKDVEPFLKGKEKVIKTGTSEIEITKENINEKEGILVLEHAR